MNQIQAITKGTTPDGLGSMLEMEPEQVFILAHEGKEYRVEIYPMQSGTSTCHYYQPTTPHSSGMSYTTVTPVTNVYAFVFDNDRLIYWGFLYELQ
jgi:hypothetical protein